MNSSTLMQNPRWKLGQQNAICWNYLGLFRDYGLEHIFFKNKTFLFFKIESWNFQPVWKKKSWNFTKFQLNQTTSIEKLEIKIGNKNCLNMLNELKFCEVSNRCWKFQLSILKKNPLYSYKVSQCKMSNIKSRLQWV